MFLSTVILGVTGDPRGGIADQLAAGAESPADPQEPGESGDSTCLAIRFRYCLDWGGAWFYAAVTPAVSQWFDYVGLEVVNASIQLFTLAALVVFCFMFSSANRNKQACHAQYSGSCADVYYCCHGHNPGSLRNNSLHERRDVKST